jgi:Ring hydroxylating alpha subunit (catalytic domain)/Rieske [2Fe-2S] domain
VCPHRGRRLLNGTGKCATFQCFFHGWRWNLEGENIKVVDRADWRGSLSDADIRLQEALVGTWGGHVFINMDPDAEALESFLAPVIARCGNFEFEKMRYRWRKTTILPVNWKLALEAFDEGYHVQQTHKQVLPYLRDYTNSGNYGPHGVFWYPVDGISPFRPSDRLRPDPTAKHDYRQYVLDFVEEFNTQLFAIVTERDYAATQRLRTEVAADAPFEVVLTKWSEFQREAAEADGAGWPPLTMEYIIRSHTDWHVFPNHIFLHSNVDGVLCYRSRPNGEDPHSCIFDVWAIERYAPGAQPVTVNQFFPTFQDHDGWGRILMQDFTNLAEMQRGVRSRGFKGGRTNPVQERPVSNFHRALREFMLTGQCAPHVGDEPTAIAPPPAELVSPRG